MNKDLYNYKARLIRVVDGDTIEVALDLGFGIFMNSMVRLNGIDAPELRSKNTIETEAATNVKNTLIKSLTGKSLILKTIKYKDKYGRYLADIYIEDIYGNKGLFVNEILIKVGYVRAYDGSKKPDWGNYELMKIKNLSQEI